MGYRSEQQMVEELAGRGAGDPEVHGHYPGQEPEQSQCIICNPALAKHSTSPVYRKKHWSEIVRKPNIYEPRDYGDNWAGDPSEGRA